VMGPKLRQKSPTMTQNSLIKILLVNRFISIFQLFKLLPA